MSQCQNQKNTIDPQNIINSYGADAVRFFILSDSPPEKDVQWSEQGMISSFKFIQKFWSLHKMILDLKINKNINQPEKIEIFTNQMIDKITRNLENFHYNVIIANLYEIYNYFSKNINNVNNKDNLLKNYEKILKVISPVIPHLSNECLDDLNAQDRDKWPEVDKQFLIKEKFDIVIQINGKDLMSFTNEINEKELLIEIKNNERLKKFLESKEIKKSVYIKNKLINLII